MRMRIILQILILLFTSCQGQTNKVSPVTHTKEEITHDTSLVPNDSTVFYFPLKSFRDTTKGVGLDSFLVAWYSRQLFALREPVISADKSENEFIGLPGLEHFIIQ